MIKIVVSMLKDLATFSILWIIQLFIFACIGFLIFGELPEYSGLTDTVILLLQTSLGQWDFSIYNELEIGATFGIIFHVIVIIMNLILLLNLVIAILTETYIRFSKVKLGLYYDGVVDAISSLKYDKQYGAMITAVPPFNVLMFLVTPLFLFTKNPRRLKQINHTLTLITYMPIAFILTVIFFAINICLIPFAYLFAIAHKIKLCFSPRIHRSSKELLTDLGIFVVLGVVFLSLSQLTDIYYFVKQLFYWKAQKLDQHKVDSISITAFTTLEKVVKGMLHEIQLDPRRDQTFVSSISLIKKLRDALCVQKCIQILIFGKFINNENMNDPTRTIETESPLTRLKIFNQMKKIIQRCTDEEGYINIKNFAALINEIRIKINIELQKQKFMDYKKNSESQQDSSMRRMAKTVTATDTKGKSTGRSYTSEQGRNYQVKHANLPQSLKRIQNKILLDFSLINPVGVIEAIEKGIDDDDD